MKEKHSNYSHNRNNREEEALEKGPTSNLVFLNLDLVVHVLKIDVKVEIILVALIVKHLFILEEWWNNIVNVVRLRNKSWTTLKNKL